MVKRKKNEMAGWGWRQCCRALVHFYIRFFMYQGYDLWKKRKANCTGSTWLMYRGGFSPGTRPTCYVSKHTMVYDEGE